MIFSIYRKEEVLCQLKIRGASEKLRYWPRPLLRPTSVNFQNLSRQTVPLINIFFFQNELAADTLIGTPLE